MLTATHRRDRAISIAWLWLFALLPNGALAESALIYYGNDASLGWAATDEAALAGFTELAAEWVDAGLPTALSGEFPSTLGDLRLFLATAPSKFFTDAEIALLRELLAAGGVVVVSHDGVLHLAQNDLLFRLGSTMWFGILDPVRTDIGRVVDDSHPLTVGLTNGDRICSFAPGEIENGSELVQDSSADPIIAVEEVGGGAVVAVADFDILSNVPVLFWPAEGCTDADVENIATFRANLADYRINAPPVADAGPDRTIECTSAAGASTTLDGTGSFDPDGDPIVEYLWTGSFGSKSGPTPAIDLPLGAETVNLVVRDSRGAASEPDTATITVEDSAAPVVTLTAQPAVLWPPNAEMTPVRIEAEVADVCDSAPVCSIASVASSDGSNGRSDWQVQDGLSLMLRAERRGDGSGRIYLVDVECADRAGNRSVSTAQILVPHDRSMQGPSSR
jgi:hypothetical protein